jgi:hypothetical protein
MTVSVRVPVTLPLGADEYIATFGTATTLFLEYGTATTPATGTATSVLTSGQEYYDFWVATEPESYYRWRVGNASASTATAYSAIFQAPVAYATRQEFLRGVDFPDTSRYDELDSLLVQATQLITKLCQRSFFRDPVGTGTKTLTLDVEWYGQRKLSLARGRDLDIISLSSVTIADYPGGAATTIASGSAGYYLAPDVVLPGESYTDLILSEQGTTYTRFPTGTRLVTLVGAFGWAAVPDLVRRATVDLARYWYNHRDNEGDPVGISAFGSPVFGPGTPRTVRDAVKVYGRGRWVG